MISLRRAKLDDHWRTIYKRNYPLVLTKLSLNGGEVFGEVSLPLNPGINAIVGKNGTGKSNFIRTIFNSLASEGSNRKKFSQLLDSSQIVLDMRLSGNDLSLSLSPLSNNHIDVDILCLLFDPCSLIPEIQKLFHDQNNIDELLESFSPITLGEDDLKVAKFITNTEYSTIKVVNIEDEYESFPILPFFVVERQGMNYDSRNMGLGELSLLYFFWLIDYIKKSDSHCLLIIEEPESFLPPLIQNRFCDVLAMTLATKGNACILSTHSEHILRKIPRTHIHIMSRVNNRVSFFSAASNLEQMDVLGLTAPKKGILIYEDRAAYLFTKSLVKASPLFVSDSFYYHESGSEGHILADLKRFPSNLPGFSILAVFDGDCRGRLDEQIKEYENYLYLPSNLSPEEHIIKYVGNLELSIVANHIGTSADRLSAAIEVAAGSDHHDYFHEIARVLGHTYDVLFSKLCELWIVDTSNNDDVLEFLTKLETKAA